MPDVTDLAARRADRALAQHLQRIARLRPLALAYVETALDRQRLGDADPLSDHYAIEDLTPSAIEVLERVVSTFVAALGERRLQSLCRDQETEEELGRALWLAHCGLGFDYMRWGMASVLLQRATEATPMMVLMEGSDCVIRAVEVTL